jgi:hypothetical protein
MVTLAEVVLYRTTVEAASEDEAFAVAAEAWYNRDNEEGWNPCGLGVEAYEVEPICEKAKE